MDGLSVKPAVVQVHDCFLSILLTAKLQKHGHAMFRLEISSEILNYYESLIKNMSDQFYIDAALDMSHKMLTNLNVDIADQVIAQVIAHVHLLHLSILLLHLCEHLL